MDSFYHVLMTVLQAKTVKIKPDHAGETPEEIADQDIGGSRPDPELIAGSTLDNIQKMGFEQDTTEEHPTDVNIGEDARLAELERRGFDISDDKEDGGLKVPVVERNR